MTDQIEAIQFIEGSSITIKDMIETLQKLDENMILLANDEPIVFLGKGSNNEGKYLTIVSQSHFEAIVNALIDDIEN